MVLAVKK